MPPSLPVLLGSLELAREDDLPDLSSIEESYRNPDPFWALLAAGSAIPGLAPPKSRFGERYDLYYDLVLRHLAARRIALRWYDKRTGWQALSYEELNARSAAQAGAWLTQGVQPGARLAIVLPFGPETVLALLTALRLGACVSLLPPLGDQFLARRLKKLAPAHIVTAPAHRPLLGPFDKAPLLLTDSTAPGRARAFDGSHTYLREDPCAALYSPLREPLTDPALLSAHDAYRFPLRDALLTFLLRPGDHLAAPGFHPTQHQPALLFAALLAGATYLHLPPEALAANPALLREHPLRSLGLTPELRDVLLKKPAGPLANVHHWFKNPEERLDADEWRAFIQAHALDHALVSNVLVDAARGGVVLGSVRRPASLHTKVLPAAGVPFRLFDVAAPTREPPPEAGLFAPGVAKKPPPDAYILLSRPGREFFYGGTLPPRRAGRIYPVDEVLAALGELPFVAGASVVAAPRGRAPSAHDFVLLVFTGAEETESAAEQGPGRHQAITRAITLHLGAEHLPDRVELYPLYPRRYKDGQVDHAACAAEYLSGTLSRKAQTPMFLRLAALRRVLTEGGPR
ncbi:MAG TPA: AMP-binding protein [Polyangia bacterium]|nr:AMP-binding protein [Polyangia bacterium]